MNILLYIVIFASKVIENALATLRLIVVANGKKMFGAILQFIIALVWVIVTGTVITDITKDPLKVVFFAFGSLVGSYVGSFIEEKMALGSNMLMAIIDADYSTVVIDDLRKNGFAITSMKAEGKDKSRMVLMIMVARRHRHTVVDLIKEHDESAMVVAESASTIHGGYTGEIKK